MNLAHEDAERAILATLAVVSATSPEKALELRESLRLQPEDFATAAHADLFRAASDFLGRGVPLELFALEAALAPSGHVRAAGGRAWLAELLTAPKGQNKAVGELARLVRESSLRRRAVDVLRMAARRVVDPELTPDEALSMGQEAWGALTNRSQRLGTAEGDVLRFAEMLDAAQRGRRDLVVPTGIRLLDEAIGGLQLARLTLVGALPGVGKSALLATIVRNIANSGRRVGMFSLEDERLWVTQRMVSLESGVPLFLLATRPLTKEQGGMVFDANERVHRVLRNVVIDDRPALTPQEVAATAADMVLNLKCSAIVVDHLGELRLSRSDRHDLDVAEALALLRDVAKRFNVPVLVASHVRRRQGMGIEDEPTLTDFANSSAPERMARVAIGLSKPRGDVLRCSILKQTNGPAGTFVDLQLAERAGMVDSLAVPAPVEVRE